MQTNPKPAAALAVHPRFVTKQNSEAATGELFRFWKAHYPHLVRRVGSKDLILTAELECAVQQAGVHSAADQLVAVNADPAEAVRSILRRAGGQ